VTNQGITNTVATLPGMASVTITGYLLHHFDNNWMAVFVMCSIVELVGVVPFLCFGRASPIFGPT
jgi:hypothetical protein